MPPITDPRAVKFSNEAIRPLSERVRDLKSDIDAATTKWFSEIAALVPSDAADILEDGRTANGDSILSGADITSMMTVLLGIQANLDAAGVAGVVSKPTVRTLR